MSAYAENAAGRSQTITKEFTVSTEIPLLQLGEINSSRAGITIPVTLIGAPEFYYAYVLQEAGSTTEPAIPADDQFKTAKAELLQDGNLVITPERLDGNGTWFVFAYTENEKGKSPVSKISVEYDETKLPKLVDFEIINVTAYSLDVKVTMLEGCEKFAVGGFRNGAYSKSAFTSAAKSSFNPDSDYPMQPYNWSDKSMTFPERLINKNRLATDEESEGLDIIYEAESGIFKYQIAVYALDKDGNGTAYVSEEFSVPAPSFGSTPTVTVTAETTTQTITPTFTANGDCAKMYVGISVPEYYTDVDWTDEASVVAFLSSIRGWGIHPYTGSPLTMTPNLILEPGQQVVAYAIPITADGKVGKLCYENFTIGRPEFKGAGNLALSLQSATSSSLILKADLTDAVSARILCVPSYFFEANYKDRLEILMYYEENSKIWKEYTAAEIAAAGNTLTFDNLLEETPYTLRAVTVDAQGLISPIQEYPDMSTLKGGGEEETTIDFSKGKGEATLKVVKEDRAPYPDGDALDLTYMVEKGANTVEAYQHFLSGIKNTPEAVEEDCKEWFTPSDANRIEFGTEIFKEWVETYFDSGWQIYGGGIAIITKDTDGNYKIADYYFAMPE